MKEFYDLIDKIYEELNSSEFVNTVTFGNIMDVDLSKQSIFRLSHINIQGCCFWRTHNNILDSGYSDGLG
jgi:hypothetical protein